MEYYLKTNDEKYLIELDIEGKNLIVSKLDCIHVDIDGTLEKEYSTIFELRNFQDYDPNLPVNQFGLDYLKMLNLGAE